VFGREIVLFFPGAMGGDAKEILQQAARLWSFVSLFLLDSTGKEKESKEMHGQ
jgi:hypothetical protein